VKEGMLIVWAQYIRGARGREGERKRRGEGEIEW
jgi:hypothetical protein